MHRPAHDPFFQVEPGDEVDRILRRAADGEIGIDAAIEAIVAAGGNAQDAAEILRSEPDSVVEEVNAQEQAAQAAPQDHES